MVSQCQIKGFHRSTVKKSLRPRVLINFSVPTGGATTWQRFEFLEGLIKHSALQKDCEQVQLAFHSSGVP